MNFVYNILTFGLVCYSFYLGFIKSEPTVKDVALLASITALNTLTFKSGSDDE